MIESTRISLGFFFFLFLFHLVCSESKKRERTQQPRSLRNTIRVDTIAIFRVRRIFEVGWDKTREDVLREKRGMNRRRSGYRRQRYLFCTMISRDCLVKYHSLSSLGKKLYTVGVYYFDCNFRNTISQLKTFKDPTFPSYIRIQI